MIRLATLNKLGGVENNKHTDKIISVMQQEPVDILCCKKSYSPEIDQHAKVRDFAQALGMTYMFSSLANGNDSGQKSRRKFRQPPCRRNSFVRKPGAQIRLNFSLLSISSGR